MNERLEIRTLSLFPDFQTGPEWVKIRVRTYKGETSDYRLK